MADTRPTPPEPSPAGHAPAVRPNVWAKFVENPLPAILGVVMVVLLGFSLTVTNARISDTNDRITRLEARMDARFTAQDKKIDKLDAKVDKLGAKVDKLDDRNRRTGPEADRSDRRAPSLWHHRRRRRESDHSDPGGELALDPRPRPPHP